MDIERAMNIAKGCVMASAMDQELQQRLYLAEKVCFEANGFLKSNGNPLVRIYLERLEDAVKKWDNGRESKGRQHIVTRED